jgi:hypothetical protein
LTGLARYQRPPNATLELDVSLTFVVTFCAIFAPHFIVRLVRLGSAPNYKFPITSARVIAAEKVSFALTVSAVFGRNDEAFYSITTMVRGP